MHPQTILIIGTGFGGLGLAIRLKQAGIDDFVLLEKADSVGGTWRDNTYPGAACDVQSHLYSYSFAPKHDWTRKFAGQSEIESYIQQCVSDYQLESHIRFGQEVARAEYDEKLARWFVHTTDGEQYRCALLVSAVGQLNQPAYPSISGQDQFAGISLHSARWDHAVDFAGQRVAVIGTGASAIQFVPELVPQVKQLTLLQRSAPWVIPKPDRLFAKIEQRLFKAVPWYDKFYRKSLYWLNESRAIGFTRFSKALKLMEWVSLRAMRKAVKDSDKRAKLTPDYPAGCKRILISDDYYPALAKEHVGIVTEPIAEITPNGVRTADGQEHPADILVYGTGFKTTQFLVPMEVTGLHGQSLNQAWQDGAEAFKGMTVHGFPNFFMLYGPNTNLAHSSIIFMLESQFNYILSAIQQLYGSTYRGLMPKAAVQSQHNDHLQKRLENTVWNAGCESWYKTASGKNTNNWPGFTFSYRLATRQLDANNYEWLI